MSLKLSHESAIELVTFANAKLAFRFLTSPSCGLLMILGHFCEMKPNFKSEIRSAVTRQFRSPDYSLCSLVSCQLCLCVTGCLIVDRLLWVVHWKQLHLPKKALCEIIESEAKQQSFLKGASKLHSWGCRVSW